jgi:AcrR family transcriptional regulator
MTSRRDVLLDAAIRVLGGRGMRGLTHRAVDAEAGLPVGSTANLFPTREKLLEAVVDRVSRLERDRFDVESLSAHPVDPAGLARALAAFVCEATGPYRTLTLARHAVLLEAGHNPVIRERVAATGGQVNAWFAAWLRLAGSRDPERDLHILGNYLVGLMTHQLAMPDPRFDPTDRIAALLEGLGLPAAAQPAGAPPTGTPATGTPATGTPATGTPATARIPGAAGPPPPTADVPATTAASPGGA